MYSFHPIADATQFHGGWYIWVVVSLIAVGMILFSYLQGEIEGWATILICIFLALFSAIVHAVSYGGTPPVNARVAATFVEYKPEGYNARTGSGKNHARQDFHEMYAVYRINETGNNVILKIVAGHEYPRNVILYKN